MREGTSGRKKFIKFLRKNLTRMLLFVVVISAGFTMRLVTRAKYVNYVNGFKHAQAGDFYFTSNFLVDGGSNYTITNWERDQFDLSIRIQNFENALLYNTAGQDFYYTVEAAMYKDAACTNRDDDFTVSIKYGNDTSGPKEFPGMSTFVKSNGIQNVDIKFDSKTDTKVEEDRYVKIVAKTLSMTDMIKLNNMPTEKLLALSGPIYEEELSATFRLTVSAAHDITSTLTSRTDSSEVIYKLKCKDTTAGAFANVLVYYKPTKMELDDMLPFDAKESTAHPDYNVIEVKMTSTSIVNLIFFKHEMSTDITDGYNKDIFFEKATN